MNAEEESANELVVGRTHRRVIMIAVFGLVALAALMLMSSEPAEAYTVTGTEVWSAPSIWAEDITVASGGDLTIQNTDVFMATTFDGEWQFVVENGGTLTVINSNITTFMGPYYGFLMDSGSTVSFVNSHVSFVGGAIFPGMIVLTGDITMNGLSITDNEMVGLFYVNGTTGFTMTNCYIANNNWFGVYIADGGASNYLFNFNGGTVIEGHSDTGLYVDMLANMDFGMTFQDTSIRMNNYGIYVAGVFDGTASLDFTSSDISGNIWSNVWIDTMSNTDLMFTAFDTHFDMSMVNEGVHIGWMGGPARSNLTMMMDSSWVLSNAGSGIYVSAVSDGWMSFDFVNTFVEDNGWVGGGYGIYTPPVAFDESLSFSAVGSSFSFNARDGIYFSSANPGSMSIAINQCAFVGNGDSGMEVGRVTDGDLDLRVTNSYFEWNSGGVGAIYEWGIYNGTAVISINNNEFNNSYAAIYFADTLEANAGFGHTLTFEFISNWHVSDLGWIGVYFSDIRHFDQTTLTMNNNHFYGREVKQYGIYFNWAIEGDVNFLQGLTMDVSSNEFFWLDESALWTNGGIWGFRNADISINSNVLMDSDFDYNYGFILMGVAGDPDYDTSLNLIMNNNIFINLTELIAYSPAFGFRHSNIDISNNVVYGNGIAMFGFILDGLMYGSTNEPSDLVFNADNNEFYDLLFGTGFYITTWGSTFFTNVDMSFTNNHFNGSTFGTFTYGIYFENDIYYHPDYDCSLNILMDNNEFIELEDIGVFFNGVIYDYSDVNMAFTNNLFENRNNIWMDEGIVILGLFHTNMNRPTSLVLTFDGNRFFDLNLEGVYFDMPIWGFRNVTLNIDRNIVENRMGSIMDYGFYFPGGVIFDTNDYDNYFHFSCRENVIRDMTQVGIYFGTWTPTYGFRHVDIQIHDNVMENVMDVNNMDFGIEWYYEIFYSTDIYDTSFVLDITGNVFRDLGWDAIAFRYNAGLDFANFANVTVNIQDNVFTNQFSGGMDHGLYLRTFYITRTDWDTSIDITILNNTFDSMMNYAVLFYSGSGWHFSGYRNAMVTISQNNFTNTMGNWMDYGVYLRGFEYWDDSFANQLLIDISDNIFMDLTTFGVYVDGNIYYYSVVDIDTRDNYFSDIYNNFNIGIYISESIYFTPDNDGYFHFASVRNEFYDLEQYGIAIEEDIYDFRNATIEVLDSIFMNTISNYMDYGVYFGGFYYDDSSWDNYFILDITNNNFENLTQYGFSISSIHYYRNVDIDIVDNHFSDIYNNFDYGVYFRSDIYHDVDYDGSFVADIIGNTFMDLMSGGVYFSSEVGDFRSVWLNIDNNDFVCYISNWMDEGVRFSDVYYWMDDYDSNFRLDVTNNNYENLTDVGFEMGEIHFRHVLINVINNQYSDVYNNFDYGFYINDDVYYTTDYDSDLTVNIMDNSVYDLRYMGIGFSGIYDFRDVTFTIDNNDFIDIISNWMDYGVYIEYLYYDDYTHDTYVQMTITNNNFENLT
ncbi:MAG: hypothetical protein KAW09_10265, partial [Thermoplasmata archaeon]|nr:hypothetical protein [Thermoplasmata archaeon]